MGARRDTGGSEQPVTISEESSLLSQGLRDRPEYSTKVSLPRG